MSVDVSYLDFVAYLPRPKSVDDWSDTSEVLERHVADLLATLDRGWSSEGPVDEADSLFMTASRKLSGDREHTIWFSFDYLDGAATMPRAVPDPMRFEVRVQEESRARAPWMPVTTLSRQGLAPFGVALLAAIGFGAVGWRASGWLMPSLAFALALIGLVVARATAPAWVGNRLHPSGPRTSRQLSPELKALAASVERYLRGAFNDVRIVDGDE